ncbi:Aldehyde dehydrogenase family protein [Pseudomonas zeae]
MVGVAQLVEHGIVTPVVVGSIPIVHPIFRKAPDVTVWRLCFKSFIADVVELVDTLDLGSSAARRKSSSLFIRTN